MNDVSPMVLVLLEFYLIIALIALLVVVWAVEHSKRLRSMCAARELGRILSLMEEAFKDHSPDKIEAVNRLIDLWDKSYSRDLDQHIQRLGPMAAA